MEMFLWKFVGGAGDLNHQGKDAILAEFGLFDPFFPLGALAIPGHVQNMLGFHSAPYDWNLDGMETSA